MPIQRPGAPISILKSLQALFMLLFLLFSPFIAAFSQPIDFIETVVGEEVILKSEVDAQIEYFLQNGEKDEGTLRCRVLEKLIIEKLLLNKAIQDSIAISEAEVESELERRINYFCEMYKGCENLEKVYQKPLVEIREELRPEIKNQMLIERQRNAIFADIKITPRDVKKFYNNIPKDSLPYMPAQVELYHLTAQPDYSAEAKAKARSKLTQIRTDIINGVTDFPTAAKENSRDLGSAKVGGNLGEFSRGKMVPEFEDAAYSLREGEISQPVETDFGFHIILLQKRVGEMLTASHILIRPEHTSNDDSLAVRKLRSISNAITSDSITFEAAAIAYSDDEATRSCGGCIRNPNTGEPRVPLDMLDVDFFFKVDKMKEGEVTAVQEWTQPTGDKAYHLIYLKKRTPPHVLNLVDDYQQIREAAIQERQFYILDEWFNSAKKNIYIEVKNEECSASLNNWNE